MRRKCLSTTEYLYGVDTLPSMKEALEARLKTTKNLLHKLVYVDSCRI